MTRNFGVFARATAPASHYRSTGFNDTFISRTIGDIITIYWDTCVPVARRRQPNNRHSRYNNTVAAAGRTPWQSSFLLLCSARDESPPNWRSRIFPLPPTSYHPEHRPPGGTEFVASRSLRVHVAPRAKVLSTRFAVSVPRIRAVTLLRRTNERVRAGGGRVTISSPKWVESTRSSRFLWKRTDNVEDTLRHNTRRSTFFIITRGKQSAVNIIIWYRMSYVHRPYTAIRYEINWTLIIVLRRLSISAKKKKKQIIEYPECFKYILYRRSSCFVTCRAPNLAKSVLHWTRLLRRRRILKSRSIVFVLGTYFFDLIR